MSSVKRRVADVDAGFHIEHLDGDGRRYVGWTRQKLDIPLSLIKLFIIKDTPTFSLVFVNFFNPPHRQ